MNITNKLRTLQSSILPQQNDDDTKGIFIKFAVIKTIIKMITADVNTNLVDSYYVLLKNLSPDNKLELIARLSKSMTKAKKTKDNSWKSLFGALVLKQTADEFVEGLKKDRNFSRKSVDLRKSIF